jgi:hypothetical protein
VGAPKFWTQQDQAIALYPTPDAQYRYSLYYIPTLAPLSVANATNWLLGKSPDVYLYAALMHFAMWAKDDAQANGFLSMYTSTLDAARNSANRYRLALASPMRQRVNGSKIV